MQLHMFCCTMDPGHTHKPVLLLLLLLLLLQASCPSQRSR
jgi:hypothetical protein